MGGKGPGPVLVRLLEPQFSEFLQLGAEAVPQWAFGSQFIEQGLGLGSDFGIKTAGAEEHAPTLGNLLFGEQS
jgi:hypothetical protein